MGNLGNASTDRTKNGNKQKKTKKQNKNKAGTKTLTQQPEASRVDKGDCNVAGAVGGGQAFVEVGETPWMHEAPAFPR